KGRAGGVTVGGGDPGPRGDILEAPAAEVAIELAAALGAGEENVDQPVAIHIAQSHAGALAENPVGEQGGVTDVILEIDAGPRRGQPGEARLSAGDGQGAPAIAGFLMPLGPPPRKSGGAGGDRHAKRQDEGAGGAWGHSGFVSVRFTSSHQRSSIS